MAEDSKISDIAPILMAAARAQMAAMMTRLEARGFEGLTPAFASIMPILDARGSRPSVLAQRAGVTKQAMSQLIKLLQQRKYVELVRDPSDTRAKVVRLTKRGIALRQACAEVRQELHKSAVRILGQPDLMRLTDSLQALIASMPGSS